MVTDVSPGSVVPSERGTYPCSENSGGGGIPSRCGSWPSGQRDVDAAAKHMVANGCDCFERSMLPGKALGRPLLVRTVEGGRHLAHEALHLVLDLLVRLQPDIEVEDHLVKSGGFYLLERVRDALCRSDQHRILREVLRS